MVERNCSLNGGILRSPFKVETGCFFHPKSLLLFAFSSFGKEAIQRSAFSLH
jgi:hypothetical protein